MLFREPTATIDNDTQKDRNIMLWGSQRFIILYLATLYVYVSRIVRFLRFALDFLYLFYFVSKFAKACSIWLMVRTHVWNLYIKN